jgi:hypothetical protein
VRFQLIFAWKTSLVSRARTDRALVLVVFQVHRRNLTLQVALLAKWSRVRAAAPGASKGVDVQVEDVRFECFLGLENRFGGAPGTCTPTWPCMSQAVQLSD